MTQFFQFEADFVDSLRCIPMQVRLNLDTCGVKLKLQQWYKFSEEQRRELVEMPCNTDVEVIYYREFLHNLVLTCTGSEASDLPVEENPPWKDGSLIPVSVADKAGECGVSLTLQQWGGLSDLQRFALLKLSRSGHENNNFLPALKEFNLL